MSYSFGMFFKQVKNEEVLPLLSKACEIMIENSENVLSKSKYYVPSLRSNKMNEYVDEYWLDTLFSLRFVYYEKYGLIGLSGYDYPEELEALFDCHVEFQNSCDQDYDYDTWSEKITIFKQCKELCADKGADEIFKRYTETGRDWYEEKEIEENLEYHRKSVLYDIIFDKLSLDDWLYDNECNEFKRYMINPINSSEKKFKICVQLKAMISKLN